MHFVGKILVVLMLVLSIVFMAFAGVVFTAHMNWRKEALAQKTKLEKEQADHRNTTADKDAFDREMKSKLTESEQKIATLQAENRGLNQEVARLKIETGELQVARRTATQQSAITSQESVARNEESLGLRKHNHDLTSKRDKELGDRTRLEDELRSLQQELAQAELKNKQLIADRAVLQQALEANGITADVTQLATKNAPPPAVDGKIIEIKPARRQGTSELVEVSLGSDDGLKMGHQMTVYRSGLGSGQKPRYLARIRIVRVDPDRSVGQVLEDTRNGVIQRGDNVTTKL